MNTETVLTDVEIGAIIGRVYQKTHSKEIGELRFKGDVVAIGRAIEAAVLQSPEIQALRKDAGLYRRLKAACSVSTEFTGPMNEGDPERWCVMRRKDGVISSFTGEQLDFAVRHIPSTPA